MNRKIVEILGFARLKRGGACAAVRRVVATGVSFAFALSSAVSCLMPTAAVGKARPATPPAQEAAGSQCNLRSVRGDIKHVIYIQFDNVHFRRDNPNVPSDLEQMPHLLDFFVNNAPSQRITTPR
jgi:hypothetical protein